MKNPVYAGFFYDIDGERYELDRSLPHPITEAQYWKIQMLLGNKYAPRQYKHKSVYNRFIKGLDGQTMGTDYKYQLICDCKHKFCYLNKDACPKCGTKRTLMKNPKYLNYIYYFNVKRRKMKGYTIKNVRQKTIEDFLKKFFREYIEVPENLKKWALYYLEELNDTHLNEQKTITDAREEKEQKLYQKKKRLRDMYMDSMISKIEFEHDSKEIENELMQFKSEESTPIVNWKETFINFLNLSVNACNIIENGTDDEKISLMREMSSNLSWNEEFLSIYNKKWLNVYISGLQIVKAKIGQLEPENNVENTGQFAGLDLLRPTLLRWLDSVRNCILNINNSEISNNPTAIFIDDKVQLCLNDGN